MACFGALARGEKTSIWLREALRQLTLYPFQYMLLSILAIGICIALYLAIGHLKKRIAAKAAALRAELTVEDPELRKQIRAATKLLRDEKSPTTQEEGLRTLVNIADTHKGSCQQRVVDILCDHLRVDNKKTQSAIIKAFRSHLIAGQALPASKLWCHCSFNFANVSFVPKVDLSGVTFSQSVDFSKTNFKSSACFANATFSQAAVFDKAVFGGFADFTGATFSMDTNFWRARFNKGASFKDTEFHGKASFDVVQADKVFDFTNTVFHEDSSFNTSVFGGASFENAQFLQSTNFYVTQFEDDTVFHQTVFSGDAIFAVCGFQGKTTFEEAVFNGEAFFEEAVFFVDTTFNDATFSKKPDFKSAEFLEGSNPSFPVGLSLSANGLPPEAVWITAAYVKEHYSLL